MKRLPLHCYFLCLAAAVTACGEASALDIQLPAEAATYRVSSLPGYALVQQNCMTCHSAHYAQSQPPTMARPYWDATVRKMKKPFGAQFPDDDIPLMVDYLVKTYGTEQASPPGR